MSSLKGTRILVTGGAGFFAARLVRQLVEKEGATVVAFDIVPEATARERLPGDGVTFVQGSVVGGELLEQVMREHRIDAVFHTASVVSLNPDDEALCAEVNVGGTHELLVAAAAVESVTSFIYTSSIDVCFEGKPLQFVDESAPIVTAKDALNPYISTKAAAEAAVLRANDSPGPMRTAAIRPAHIYGPGDLMISIVLSTVARGEIPARFRNGDPNIQKEALNAYVFVDNLVDAHILAMKALRQPQPASTEVAGKAFFVADHQVPMWEHMEPFLRARNLAAPSGMMPRWPAYAMGSLNEFGAAIYKRLVGRSIPLTLTRYSVLAITTDFTFDTSAAKKVLKWTPKISREEAVQRTLPWVKEIDLLPQSATRHLETLHSFYGAFLSVLGIFLFLFPQVVSQSMGLSAAPFPAPSAIIGQTSGLICFVLGTYSLAASFLRWNIAFYAFTAYPKIVTGLMFAGLVATGKMPLAFALPAATELSVGLLSLVLSRRAAKQQYGEYSLKWAYCFDRLFVAQMLHTVASGLFALGMAFVPALLLPGLVPGASDPTTIVWGHCMGVSETLMTFTYFGSGFIVAPDRGLENFAILSVFSRLGALAMLTLAWSAGITSSTQVMGCFPDGILALITAWALRTGERTRAVGSKDKIE